MKLNLTAKTKEQELILEYLEKSASEELADKINKGVQIEKDGKPLLNKKDLDGFMRYACDEARKLSEKGATSTCIESNTVFGWAIHYFEEDSIIGKLYTLDGTEYKPLLKSKPKPTPHSVPSTPPKLQPKPQMSLFDLMDTPKEETHSPIIEENGLTVDCETGEIISETSITENIELDDGFEEDLRAAKAFDKECLCILYELFGDKLTVR